jgi:hypothetical protein
MGNLGRHKRKRRSQPTEGDASSSKPSTSEDPASQSVASIAPSPSTLKKAPPLSSALQKAPPPSTLQKAVLNFTAEELSAFLNFLQRDKDAACYPNSEKASTTTTVATEDSTTRTDPNAATATTDPNAATATTNPNAATGATAAATATTATEVRARIDSRDSHVPLNFNNQHVDFGRVLEFELDFDCFAYKTNDVGRQKRGSREAIRQAESRASKTIVSAIIDAGEDDQQRALALHRALIDPRTRQIAKSAGFKLERMEAISFHWNQLKKMVEAGSSKTGKSNIDQSLVIDTTLAAVAGDLVCDADGAINIDEKAPPLSTTLDLVGITVKSGRMRLRRAIQKRKELLLSKGASRNAKWSMILKRQWKGKGKISPFVKTAVVNWIKSHENVVTSPIYNETILVKEPGSNEKRRMPKLLLEIPVRELHNLLVAPLDQGGLSQSRDADVKIIVSHTTLRRIIKKDLP